MECRKKLRFEKDVLRSLELDLSHQLMRLYKKQARRNRVRQQTLFNLCRIVRHKIPDINRVSAKQMYYNGAWHIDISHWLEDKHLTR